MSDETGSDNSLSSLDSISKGATLFLIGKGISNVVSFVTNLILTRTLGAGLYGIYSYLRAIFSLFYVLTRLGSNNSILRYLPEYNGDARMQNIILSIAYLTSLGASVLVFGLVYYFAPVISEYTLDDPLFVDVLRVGALFIPFNTLANITYSSFKAIERMDYHVAVSSIAEPLLRLVFVGGAVLLGYSVIGAAAGLVVTGISVFVLSIIILKHKTDLGRFERPNIDQAKEYYKYSIPLTFSHAGSVLYNRVDILIVGILLSGSAVGIYNIAVLIAGLIALPLTAFNQLFPPIASRLYHNDKTDELENTYGTVTRWIFTISLFPSLVAILYSTEILRVFGEEFPEGAAVLILFAFAQLTNSVVGPSGYLLMMTDHQYIVMFNKLSSGILNAILNYVFILEFGFIGAAVATAGVLTGINILRLVQVWYFEGMAPYDLKYIKPLTAGVSAVLVMYSVSLVLDQYLLLVTGTILGGITFGLLLLLFGFETEDVAMFKQLLP